MGIMLLRLYDVKAILDHTGLSSCVHHGPTVMTHDILYESRLRHGDVCRLIKVRLLLLL